MHTENGPCLPRRYRGRTGGMSMQPTDKASRRSVIRSFCASMAAAGAGLFGVAHAQTSDTVKKTSSDNPAPDGKPPLFSSWVTYGGLVFIAGKGEHGPGD